MTSSTPAPARPARRSVVKGAAWAVPAVTLATAAPAVAASPGCVSAYTASICPTFWGLGFWYEYAVHFRNDCADEATIEVTLTAQRDGNPQTTTVTLTLAEGDSGSVSNSYGSIFGFPGAPQSISVTFIVDDIPGGSATFNPPLDCLPEPSGNVVRVAQRKNQEGPSDDEIRTLLGQHPELLDRSDVKDYLRSHPEADPRTSSHESQAPAPAPAETSTEEPADTPPADLPADTAEVTASPNE